MKLNLSKGNMYDFITHTGNTIKGECSHDCSYCYMKRWGKLKKVRLDKKELKTPMTEGNYIFVGSSCDMFANDIPDEWIEKTLEHCDSYWNRYFFQSKNPWRMRCFSLPKNSVVCTTIETNRNYNVMGCAPKPRERADGMRMFRGGHDRYVTIEPVMDFDFDEMFELIVRCDPTQVNIGSDSGNHGLPEPTKDKLLNLIEELEKVTVVKQKANLKRLLK